MQVTLNIPNKNHWEALVPLLKEFNITFEIDEGNISEEEQAKRDWAIIRQGAHIDNFEEFMKEFEESREDRKLPFRD